MGPPRPPDPPRVMEKSWITPESSSRSNALVQVHHPICPGPVAEGAQSTRQRPYEASPMTDALEIDDKPRNPVDNCLGNSGKPVR